MKKYVWLLAIAAFAVAVLAMVGCRPAETPTASPSPTAPTPTPDTKCPAIRSVVVRNVYEDAYERNVEKTDGSFTITITFDEDVAGDWSCILDEDSWTVKVVNATRKDSNFEEGVSAQVTDVEKKAKNKIAITATITEKRTVNGTTYEVYGLLCSEDDATQYVESLKLEDYEKPTIADTVTFKLKSTCKVYDQLGNTCCGLEGEACCAPVCEPVTIPSGCPLQ
jgi:hypothetical protein